VATTLARRGSASRAAGSALPVRSVAHDSESSSSEFFSLGEVERLLELASGLTGMVA
jgi:hypothetical protein